MVKPIVLLAALIVAAPSYAGRPIAVPIRTNVNPSIRDILKAHPIDTEVKRSAAAGKAIPPCVSVKHFSCTEK